ncbi:putative G-protein coupled receptor CG31760 [Araneus ventricosus]|uniref:Putative G-protein coupled receptor CG31760 n=1 Tax=Araneus ventricosus TaxID=182803 RepID=A0A4Y2JN12_ARAVE|nr:putative G-protein coupled receptor CG31760 [Araneus ventricosus]
MLYICKPCQPGCDVCEDDSPCLAHYNWAFRISLLTISVICIFLTLLLSFYVYRYRKLKVINVASPIFLCITLLGCVIMYCELYEGHLRADLVLSRSGEMRRGHLVQPLQIYSPHQLKDA